MDRPRLEHALRDRDRVLAAFLAPDGSLRDIPTRIGKRLVVLDHLAQRFAIGRTYEESVVNAVLRAFHPDVAALRRYLVEEGFLERRDGVYWRAGGTVDLWPRRDDHRVRRRPARSGGFSRSSQHLMG